MADLEIPAQKAIGVDSTFAHRVYKKDDGSQNVFEINSSEIIAWQLTYNKLSNTNWVIIYTLWQTHRLLTPFTWLNGLGEEWNVKFLKTPKFQIIKGNKKSCSFIIEMISQVLTASESYTFAGTSDIRTFPGTSDEYTFAGV